ncbi:MAG: helix-turn-helix domain-containing protein [Clostridia bacterium]|nr:helix-turn-helix domain-containing protein [Clostridia bacterium]
MLREKNGLTQADVASKLGVTPAAVSKWENGSSKPRVEVLFQLAQLLGVRAEELMCGQYIQAEVLDPEVVKQINERYNYLVKVDSYDTAGVKWRRLLAWVVDWNIIGLTVMLLVSVFSAVMDSISKSDSTAVSVITMLLMLLYPICFVLRDLIFGGRSLGKRIFGLAVLDRQTGTQAKAGKCVLRNLFLFIVQIDAIVMLISGSTVGDRVAHTVVVRKNALDSNADMHDVAEINQYVPPKKPNIKKIVLTVVLIVVVVIVFIAFVILQSLSAVRNTEEYKVAYDYFVESQAFEELDIDESKIWHNSYSRTTYSEPSNDAVTQTAEIGFIAKGKAFTVICHKQNGVWTVCEECTRFD